MATPRPVSGRRRRRGPAVRALCAAALLVVTACGSIGGGEVSSSASPGAVGTRPDTVAAAAPTPSDDPQLSDVQSPDAQSPDGQPSDGQAAGVTPSGSPSSDAAPPGGPPSASPPQVVATAAPLPDGVSPPPDWLGTRPLQVGPDGAGLPEATPEELVVRRLATVDLLAPPPPDAPYASTISPLTDEVVARSTWTPGCPVTRQELVYVTVSFWGFDQRPHTGEMIVNAGWAEEVVAIFGELFDARYPIEAMRIVTAEELEGTPTGDGNVTSAFVCRPVRGSTTWSQHAYGLAVDVNPFINPYQRGERILPELAGAYLDRGHERPGMLAEGHVAVQAFDAIGWGWGGRWNSLIDWMHFSANGR